MLFKITSNEVLSLVHFTLRTGHSKISSDKVMEKAGKLYFSRIIQFLEKEITEGIHIVISGNMMLHNVKLCRTDVLKIYIECVLSKYHNFVIYGGNKLSNIVSSIFNNKFGNVLMPIKNTP